MKRGKHLNVGNVGHNGIVLRHLMLTMTIERFVGTFKSQKKLKQIGSGTFSRVLGYVLKMDIIFKTNGVCS